MHCSTAYLLPLLSLIALTLAAPISSSSSPAISPRGRPDFLDNQGLDKHLDELYNPPKERSTTELTDASLTPRGRPDFLDYQELKKHLDALRGPPKERSISEAADSNNPAEAEAALDRRGRPDFLDYQKLEKELDALYNPPKAQESSVSEAGANIDDIANAVANLLARKEE